MTTPDLLVDTSAAVALLLADHPAHGITHDQIGQLSLGLCGHAAFETFSVLTRLPAPMRQPSATVVDLLAANFPLSLHLPADESALLVAQLADLGVTGGAVYDALVAATARHHDVALATLDQRALPTYRALGVTVVTIAE